MGQDRFKRQWDFDNDSFVTNNSKEVKIALPENNYFECSRVVSIEQVTVPPKCEMLIKSKISRSVRPKEGILIPDKKFMHSYGLALARVLVDTSNDILFARVYNPSDLPVTVHKTISIAFFTPVHKVNDNLSNVGKVETSRDTNILGDHLKDTFNRGSTNLNSEQKEMFKEFLIQRQKSFAKPGEALGKTNLGKHRNWRNRV